MLRITLLCVGTPRSSWILDGIQQYTERLQHDIQLEIVSLSASKEKNADKQREEESARILEAVAKREGEPWLLDEKGKSMTSPDFSSSIQMAHDEGRSLIFILGGAYGVTDAVRTTAQKSLRLSDMVFPHELCQVVFLEQLYRAIQIQKGTGYHH